MLIAVDLILRLAYLEIENSALPFNPMTPTQPR